MFYYRLLVNYDDFGRMDARPAILRARLFPLHAQMPLSDVEAALDLLEQIGCVRRYTAQGRAYLQVVAWPNHQRGVFPAAVYDGVEDDAVGFAVGFVENQVAFDDEDAVVLAFEQAVAGMLPLSGEVRRRVMAALRISR